MSVNRLPMTEVSSYHNTHAFMLNIRVDNKLINKSTASPPGSQLTSKHVDHNSGKLNHTPCLLQGAQTGSFCPDKLATSRHQNNALRDRQQVILHMKLITLDPRKHVIILTHTLNVSPTDTVFAWEENGQRVKQNVMLTQPKQQPARCCAETLASCSQLVATCRQIPRIPAYTPLHRSSR